jgi:hypothetical protein
MKKYQAIAAVKSALQAIEVFKGSVYRGKPISFSQFPSCYFTVPICEQFINEFDKKKLPFIFNLDLIICVNTQNSNGPEMKDDDLDIIVELVKNKINLLPDGTTIIGVEWQHDEEFEGDNAGEIGMAIVYKLQYRDAPIGR